MDTHVTMESSEVVSPMPSPHPEILPTNKLLDRFDKVHEFTLRTKDGFLETLFDAMKRRLKEVKRKKDFLAESEALRKTYQTGLTTMETEIVKIKTRLERRARYLEDLLRRVEKQTELLDSFSAEFSYVDELERKQIGKRITKAATKLWQGRETLLFYDQDVKAGFLCQLQTETQRLMDGWSGREKEMLFEKLGWASHVTRAGENDRPKVCLEEGRKRYPRKVSKTGEVDDDTLACAPHLPIEVKSIIYSLADLESTVILRQVDKSWYYTFQQLERLWKDFLRDRNPWIRPQSCNVSSWADCVLIFAARLRTWSAVDNIDDIEIPDTPAITKTVVGVPLSFSETLPSSFEPLCAHKHRNLCHFEVCEHLHTDVYQKFVDLGTGQFLSEQEYDPKPEYVGHEIFGHEYWFEKDSFYVDPIIDREDISHVVLGPSCIAVFFVDGQVSLMSHKIPFVAGGILLDNVYEGNMFLFDDVQLVRTELGEDRFSFSVAHYNMQALIPYCFSSHPYGPVAAYNGSIWWSIGNQSLVPTMMDFDKPGKVLYGKDRAIRVPEQWQFTQGNKTPDSKRFVCATYTVYGNTMVIDLKTGIVTRLVVPDDKKGGRVIPGFQNGHFYPRSLSEVVVDKWNGEAEDLRYS